MPVIAKIKWTPNENFQETNKRKFEIKYIKDT